jgi:hypothetical protein
VQTLRRVPSQAPPQIVPSVAHAARLPAGAPVTAVHVPSPDRLQASHCPSQADSQQTPSTQWPVAHWPAAVQVCPLASWGTQLPPEHQDPAAHWPSALHVAKQAAASQTYGAHAWVWAEGQRPAPSQVAAAVAVPSAQEADLHEVETLG